MHLFVVVFPFLKPVLQLVSSALLQGGSSKGAKAAKFMINTAEEVMQLRRQTGASQVLAGDKLSLGSLDNLLV